jgi:hypothetical protein
MIPDGVMIIIDQQKHLLCHQAELNYCLQTMVHCQQKDQMKSYQYLQCILRCEEDSNDTIAV